MSFALNLSAGEVTRLSIGLLIVLVAVAIASKR